MKNTDWIIASFVVVMALGFGHAGCHTSGIPGGTGAGGDNGLGGAAATGGVSDNEAGVEQDAASASSPCTDDYDCAADKQVCVGGACVDCLSDTDCVSTGKGNVCENEVCQTCVAARGCGTNQRCFRNECIPTVACSSDRTACIRETPPMTCGTAGYCMECVDDDGCKQYAPAVCSTQRCTCDGTNGICLLGDRRVNLTDAG